MILKNKSLKNIHDHAKTYYHAIDLYEKNIWLKAYVKREAPVSINYSIQLPTGRQ